MYTKSVVYFSDTAGYVNIYQIDILDPDGDTICALKHKSDDREFAEAFLLDEADGLLSHLNR
jgi:hypothetical protein